jgi:hypothetical protein
VWRTELKHALKASLFWVKKFAQVRDISVGIINVDSSLSTNTLLVMYLHVYYLLNAPFTYVISICPMLLVRQVSALYGQRQV